MIERNPNRDQAKLEARAALKEMYDLGTGADSTLELTDNMIGNYDLLKLTSQDRIDAGLVRAARFLDGMFLSVRLEHGSSLIQHDLTFYSESSEPTLPAFRAWDVGKRLDGSLARAKNPHGHFNWQSKFGEQLPEIVLSIRDLLGGETSEDLWKHAYTREQLLPHRLARRVLYIDALSIRTNPELDEPYL